MDEGALDARTAQLLCEQFAHWDDLYHLMEALGSENHAHGRLKRTAFQIEGRDWALHQSERAVASGTLPLRRRAG